MPASDHDRLLALAKRRRCAMTVLLREAMQMLFRHYREDLE